MKITRLQVLVCPGGEMVDCHGEVPRVGAGDSLRVDVVAQRLSAVIDSRPHVDLRTQTQAGSASAATPTLHVGELI